MILHAGCAPQDGVTDGSVRLRGGFGTPCDPLHSGFIEVLHDAEWGSICTSARAQMSAEDDRVADVTCRQLGFPHGTRVNPLSAIPTGDAVEEAEEPSERFWLSSVTCRGPEGRLIDCDLGPGFRENNAGCSPEDTRIHGACRQFPVAEAFEAKTTPDAGLPSH